MRLIGLVATALALAFGPAGASVLDRAKETGELRIAYRDDAQPFSYKNAEGGPAGYSVALCEAVAREVAAEIGRADLAIVPIEVGADDRLTAVPQGKADILCEATTVTFARRATMDFSLLTFVTGATLIYPAQGASRFEELAGKKVGVLAGSTTEAGLGEALQRAGIAVEVVAVPTHTAGTERLASGEFAAYFGDGAILLYHLMQSPFRDRLRLSDKVLSFEPYALGLPKGDDAFRLVADRALARLSRSGAVARLFEASFGAGATPSDLVKAMWLLNSIPD
jgi:polar amino acid transport system substrate-binding protein/glutamate/aspartate transport system substrate-binding protein